MLRCTQNVIDESLLQEVRQHVEWLKRKHPEKRPENLNETLAHVRHSAVCTGGASFHPSAHKAEHDCDVWARRETRSGCDLSAIHGYSILRNNMSAVISLCSKATTSARSHAMGR